jgi:hypothetical protein
MRVRVSREAREGGKKRGKEGVDFLCEQFLMPVVGF